VFSSSRSHASTCCSRRRSMTNLEAAPEDGDRSDESRTVRFDEVLAELAVHEPWWVRWVLLALMCLSVFPQFWCVPMTSDSRLASVPSVPSVTCRGADLDGTGSTTCRERCTTA